MTANNSSTTPNRFTWVGIFLSMFTITAISLVFKSIFGNQLTNGQMMTRELLIFGMVVFLLFYIIPKEKLDLSSIGLHNRHWGRSLLLTVGIFVVCFAALLAGLEISKLLGWKFGESKSFDLLSKPVIAFITLRAGVAEEVFMRGFYWNVSPPLQEKNGWLFYFQPFLLVYYTIHKGMQAF